ncbi:MAG: L,D-transpeptidase [Pseudomonadota bacterium]|nr:L,D-transpeptidase [Pseudomonadota bacterium]
MKHLLAAAAVFLTILAAAPVQAAVVEARIDLSEQRMRVYQNGLLRYTWKVSTARRGYVTPTGSYGPTRMHKMWHSRKYNMSPMPHSIFFRGGYAIHGTNEIKRLGQPASHGCVRLHPEHARLLFGMVKSVGAGNTRIRINH